MLETIDFTGFVALLHMNKANFIPSNPKRTGDKQRGLFPVRYVQHLFERYIINL